MEKNIVDWQSELNTLSVKYFKIASWVALILNPLWALSDYFVTPEYWFSFCIIRFSISIFVLALLLIHNKKKLFQELKALNMKVIHLFFTDGMKNIKQ